MPGNEQAADILTKTLVRIKYKEMSDLMGVHDLKKMEFYSSLRGRLLR